MTFAGKAHGQSTLAAASGINRWPTRHGVLGNGISPMFKLEPSQAVVAGLRQKNEREPLGLPSHVAPTASRGKWTPPSRAIRLRKRIGAAAPIHCGLTLKPAYTGIPCGMGCCLSQPPGFQQHSEYMQSRFCKQAAAILDEVNQSRARDAVERDLTKMEASNG